MARKNTIKLLLINGSDNDSERLVSLFRSAGRVARAERIGKACELPDVLRAGSWDLLIADDQHPELNIETALQHWRSAAVDFPAIVQRAGADLATLFSAGVSEVVAPDEDQRLLYAALRELETVELRRHADRLKNQLREAEQRNALLLGEADQAIAYIADGMIISANPLFAQSFGYTDTDDLDCLPIIDLVAPQDHERFKALLKGGTDTNPLQCLREEGDTFAAILRLHSASYDGEPCTQLIVDLPTADERPTHSGYDVETGLRSRDYLREQLAETRQGSLLCIGIDQFAALRRQFGFSNGGLLLTELARFIAAQEPLPDATLTRLGDDSLAVLTSADPEQALIWARELCRAVEAHIIETGGQSRQCTVSIGIATRGGPAATVLDTAFAACEQVRAEAGDTGVGNGVAVHTPAASGGLDTAIGDQPQALESALEEHRFALLFQPIISLRGASGEHYEVLLRMRGDTDELELPDNFLEALGASAEHAKLDRWILLEATKRLAENRAAGNDTRLLINLTVNALQDESLASWLGVALKAAGLPGSALILQLRETDLVHYLRPAKLFAEAVRQLGCRLSVGGFGRVLDPLKTLKNMPADWVQVDGDFTRSLQTGGDAQPLKALVSTLGEIDVRVIVPSVENAQVLATLWQVGADFIQGHYLQAPGRDMNYEFTDIA